MSETTTAPTTNGKPKPKRKPAKPSKPAAKMLPPKERAVIREAEASAAYQLEKAQAVQRLRHTAGEWVAHWTFMLSSLVDELGRVARQAEATGSLLGEVIDPEALVKVLALVEAAESRAGTLRCVGMASLDLPELVEHAKAEDVNTTDSLFEFSMARRELKKFASARLSREPLPFGQ